MNVFVSLLDDVTFAVIEPSGSEHSLLNVSLSPEAVVAVKFLVDDVFVGGFFVDVVVVVVVVVAVHDVD